MSSNLNDLCKNYKNLISNLDQVPNNPVYLAKIKLIDQMIINANIEVENMNFEIIKHKVTMTEKDKQDFEDMVITNNTIKVFSPYITWFNLCQKLSKDTPFDMGTK